MSLLESGDRWYMYTSNLFHRGWAIFDVTDPTDPTLVKFIDGPENTATWQLDLADNLLITSLDALSTGWGGDAGQPRAPEAVLIWSLEDPVNPRQIGSFTTGGGTHRNAYFGGDYLHLAANLPGYRGEVYMIVDISDPANPFETGRFATTGMKETDAESYDLGRLHGPPGCVCRRVTSTCCCSSRVAWSAPAVTPRAGHGRSTWSITPPGRGSIRWAGLTWIRRACCC